jgi:hypothetical protein
MASEKQIEANRRNSLKSSGPKTAEGKARVRLNAIKHGLTAATVVLPGEDPAVLEARVEAWKDDIRPAGALEDYLVERAAHASWQLDRADRTIAARLAASMRRGSIDRAADEAEEVADLARRLFWDPRGPIALYPHPSQFSILPRVSWSPTVDDPLDPARIVGRLESMETGCRWLLDRWAELRKILDDGMKWQPPDRLRAVRLLGRQPLDALDDERLLSIYMGCKAMDPRGNPTFDDLAREMGSNEPIRFAGRVEGRDVEARTPAHPEAGRAMLLAVVDRAVSRLEALLALRREPSHLERPDAADALAFDDSDEGERLRRYQLASGRTFFRAVGTLLKVRKEAGRDPGDQRATADTIPFELPHLTTPAIVDPPAFESDETNPISPAIPTADVRPTTGTDALRRPSETSRCGGEWHASQNDETRPGHPDRRVGDRDSDPQSSADRGGVELPERHRLVQDELREDQAALADLLGHHEGVIALADEAHVPARDLGHGEALAGEGDHGRDVVARDAELQRRPIDRGADDVQPDREAVGDRVHGIRPAMEQVLAADVPGVHEPVETRVERRDHGVIGQEAVVGGRHEVAIGAHEDVDVLALHHIVAQVLTDRLDLGLIGQGIETDGPPDQKLADVVQRDRELLARVILHHDPAGGHIDDLAPGALGRQVRQTHGLADDLIEDHRGLAGDGVDHLSPPLAEHRQRGDQETRAAQCDQTGPETARSAHHPPPRS